MKPFVWAIALLAIATIALAALKGTRRKTGPGEKPKKKAPLTDHEQRMYNRLTSALPDLIVMPQVAFSALLTARTTATRNTFDRKIADFVICDRALQVQAVIELDDSSHRGREAQDARRDTLLTAAGYRVLRYARIPDIDQVKADLDRPALTAKPPGARPKSGIHIPTASSAGRTEPALATGADGESHARSSERIQRELS